MMKQFRKLVDHVMGPYFSGHSKYETAQIPAVNKQLQILLRLKYQELHHAKLPLPSFEEAEFRAFSQNGEDGILHFIFSLIGTTNKRTVEICCGNGIESMTANLILHHGFRGLLIDGNETNIQTARHFFAGSKDTFISPPRIILAWVTAENINELIAENKFTGEIDLLSLDMDGMDWWIWKALTHINPRVIVLEYHEELGYNPVNVPYDPRFEKGRLHPRYFGASLSAFVKLAKEKGYRLVGSNRQKFNAFFVRNDIGAAVFPEVPFTQCMRNPDPASYTLVSEELNAFPFERI